MPMHSSGTSEPPITALFEVSEAITPSIIPVPNFSGCFERDFSAVYANNPAVDPPMPGKIPITIPMIDEIIAFGICWMNSIMLIP